MSVNAKDAHGQVWAGLAALLATAMVFSIVFGASLAGAQVTLPIIGWTTTVTLLVVTVLVLSVATYIGLLGLRELLLDRRFSVEFLMALAAFGAVYLRFFFEAATVLFLYCLAEYFERYIEVRARRSVEHLSELVPDRAVVVENGIEKMVNVKDVKPGMTLIVSPGKRIALDGVVTEGASSVDQSLITGESFPVERREGDNVYAGTLNISGPLLVRVTKAAEDTLVSRIIKLVMESKSRKAKVERFVERVARVYVPIVVVLAAFTAFGMPRLLGGAFNVWLYRSLMLLVVSCPSAFILSVPATVFTAITVAARRGVLVKGGVYIERLALVKGVVFDKTGTLTLGTPVVHDISSVDLADDETLLYAAALEQFSKHPLAHTIVQEAEKRKLDYKRLHVRDVVEFPGKGVVGYVNDAHVVVGKMALMKELGCDCERIQQFYEEEVHTAVCVAINKAAVASFCIMDEVREDAKQAVKALKNEGIYTVMLTGDKKEIAQQVAEELEMDEAHAELFPEGKLRMLNEVRAKLGVVSMVGDGVNDAPALAASDVGIAMGGSRVDAAVESADIILVKDRLTEVPYMIGLSKKTMKIARQNIFSSLTVKIALGILGFLGLIPLWFTVAAGDDGVTMLLLLNAVRLTRYSRTKKVFKHGRNRFVST